MGDQRPEEPGEAPDLLTEVLKLARRQGALEGEDLEAFVTGLRARAERVVAERLGRSETELGVLRNENQWRKDAMAAFAESVRSLEAENAWLRDTIGNLEAERQEATVVRESLVAQHEAERQQAAVAHEALFAQQEAERRKASVSHEALLAHHQELMARFADQLGDIASLSPLRAGEIRRRLRALAALLRADTR